MEVLEECVLFRLSVNVGRLNIAQQNSKVCQVFVLTYSTGLKLIQSLLHNVVQTKTKQYKLDSVKGYSIGRLSELLKPQAIVLSLHGVQCVVFPLFAFRCFRMYVKARLHKQKLQPQYMFFFFFLLLLFLLLLLPPPPSSSSFLLSFLFPFLFPFPFSFSFSFSLSFSFSFSFSYSFSFSFFISI